MKSKWVIGFVIFLAVLGVINLIDFSESPSLAPEERGSCVCLPDLKQIKCQVGFEPSAETGRCSQNKVCGEETCEFKGICIPSGTNTGRPYIFKNDLKTKCTSI